MTSRATGPNGSRSAPNSEPRSTLVGQLAEEMVARWQAGDEAFAEEYLDLHPELWLHPDAALELIAEELALREEHDRPTSPRELAERFPDWQQQVETLWRCQHAFRHPPDTRRFPSPGEEIGGFRLLTELGRGANGRVFLAAQSALGGRTVVLKLTPKAGREHLSLARLQHTHIVPLYSAHEFPDRGLRGLCLPYFGRATLATLLGDLARCPAGERTGKDLLAALAEVERQSPFPLPVSGPVCDRLRVESYVQTVCQIGACLADALEYAHERGLVHLDIKPSNVLIGADGTPMLLDFHLARPPLEAGDAPPAWLGGTPEYMAPELAVAVEAVREGAKIPVAVDGRADIYSLGLLLREALDGPGCGGPLRLPTGLTDILTRCTAPDPSRRYLSAAQLASDLRRHLADLPLKGVPNRSLPERWGKWRRRNPLALPGLLVSVAVILAGAGFGFHTNERIDRAATALREGETHLHSARYAESLAALRGGEAILSGVPFSGSLKQRLHTSRQAAERAQTATELHRFCDQVRPLYAAGVIAPAEVREAETRCQQMWAERHQIAARLDGQPTAELTRQWRADLLDLGILTAHLHVRLAPPGGEAVAHKQALAILNEAEALLGPSGVLYLECAAYARVLGEDSLEEEVTRRAATLPPQTAWEHLVVGRTFLAAGDLAPAGAAFERCLALEPGSLWGNHYRGVCLLRLGDADGASAAFTACVALSPQTPWFFHNRGLARTESGRLDWAGADFDRALAINPKFAAALLGRAIVHLRAGRHAEALADLRSARDAGLAPAAFHFHTAAVQLASGNRAAAIAALRECLNCDPGHKEALTALARLHADR